TTATVSGPSPSSPSRALFNNPGTASRSARCSSLYQGLNSASLTAGTSAHTIRSPLPFFAVVDSLMHGPFRGRIVDQAAAECQREAGRGAGPCAVSGGWGAGVGAAGVRGGLGGRILFCTLVLFLAARRPALRSR